MPSSVDSGMDLGVAVGFALQGLDTGQSPFTHGQKIGFEKRNRQDTLMPPALNL